MRARAAAGTVLAATLVLGGAGTAVADVEPSPEESPSAEVDGYAPPPVLTVDVLEPICDGDVPYLRYAVDVENLEDPPDTVDITWVNPEGDDVVQAGLPLTGRVLWPGAEVGPEGEALDWPGWSFVDGEWVVGDEFDWVRPSVSLEFEVNPTATATVGYPEASPACATPPGTPEPTIDVDTLTPLCVAGVTYLDYAVEVTGTPNDTVTLTWDNPDGEDYVHADQPLSGRVLWPGAYPERFVDLPADEGWELVNNMWQNTRDFGWAVGDVDVTFAVNPEVTVTVTYPDDTENCVEEEVPPGEPGDTPDPGENPNDPGANPNDPGESELPRTGGEVAGLIALAAGLLAVGTATVLLVRRRRHAED
ncbi:LPXTG cell wall anchor domain-containing protein [Isoptericola dokdonensis]|uniref:LPXTG cell wall anchor domain-containing protein n=1 Tax=Isoptericola dokdonensis TaxID=372663 RepID=UPI000834F57D|nr:LPXTG cell wall anchor domain-containing protein [Isoptericola dokdonensis]